MAKLLAFWILVIGIALYLLYIASMVLYLGFYYLVLVPPKVVSLTQPLNLRYPDPGTTDYIYAHHCVSPITYPQQYNWKLSLRVPESPQNFEAGVFMVSLALYPPDQLPNRPQEEVRDMFYKHLQGSVGNPSLEFENVGDSQLRIGSRPLMLRYRPEIYRWIHTIVYAVPRLAADLLRLDWFAETQDMEINLIERHTTSRNSTISTKQCFVVSFNNPRVQIYSAHIEATVLLEGWRYLLYYWFWTCLFVGTASIWGVLVFSVSAYLLIRLITKVVRGEIQLPRWWMMTDDEQQMKDMKDAVASLMQKKKEETKSRQRQLQHDKHDDHSRRGHIPSSSHSSNFSETRTSHRSDIDQRRHTHEDDERESLTKKSSPTSTPSRKTRRPPSWLDEPLAAPSGAPSTAPQSEPYDDEPRSSRQQRFAPSTDLPLSGQGQTSSIQRQRSSSSPDDDEDDYDDYFRGPFDGDDDEPGDSHRGGQSSRVNRFERDSRTAAPSSQHRHDSFRYESSGSEQSQPIAIPKTWETTGKRAAANIVSEETHLQPSSGRTPAAPSSDLTGGDLGVLLAPFSVPSSGRASPSIESKGTEENDDSRPPSPAVESLAAPSSSTTTFGDAPRVPPSSTAEEEEEENVVGISDLLAASAAQPSTHTSSLGSSTSSRRRSRHEDYRESESEDDEELPRH